MLYERTEQHFMNNIFAKLFNGLKVDEDNSQYIYDVINYFLIKNFNTIQIDDNATIINTKNKNITAFSFTSNDEDCICRIVKSDKSISAYINDNLLFDISTNNQTVTNKLYSLTDNTIKTYVADCKNNSFSYMIDKDNQNIYKGTISSVGYRKGEYDVYYLTVGKKKQFISLPESNYAYSTCYFVFDALNEDYKNNKKNSNGKKLTKKTSK